MNPPLESVQAGDFYAFFKSVSLYMTPSPTLLTMKAQNKA